MRLHHNPERTKTIFAKYIGKSVRQVSRYEAEGMPSARSGSGRGGNRINFADAWQWFVNREIQKRMPSTTGPSNIDAERLRLISEQADEKAIKNAKDRGELIEAEYVQEFTMTATAILVGALSGLAGRMANQVAPETDPAKCRSLLKIEIDRARVQFAKSFGQLAQSFDERANAIDA